jgi:photosystem I subunit 10
MLKSLFIAATQQIGNDTSMSLQLSTPIMMTLSSLLVLFIASRTIQHPHVGPKMPLGPLGPIFNNISLAGFIGSISLGHILGALVTLGVAR